MYQQNTFGIICIFVAIAPWEALAGEATDPAIPDVLTYESALRLVVENDPALAVNRLEAEAADGHVGQAALRPNPVVGVEVENFLGTGPFRGVEGVEATVGVRQEFETAGKRKKRTEVARRKRSLVDWEREARLAELKARVRERFTAVLLARERLTLARELEELAEESAGETARLVEAARAASVEGARARLAVRRQRFAVRQAEQALGEARVRLAALWGGTEVSFSRVAGDVWSTDEMPSLRQLVSLLPATAALLRFGEEREMREAALELEQARAKPNFELFGGARYINEGNGDGMFVFGIEMPWPLFDQNQGNIRSARARLRAVDHRREQTRRELVQDLAVAYHELRSAIADLGMIEEELLTSAEETLKATQEGYKRGQFTLLGVLESREALYEIRSARLDALERLARARARIKALTRPATMDHQKSLYSEP